MRKTIILIGILSTTLHAGVFSKDLPSVGTWESVETKGWPLNPTSLLRMNVPGGWLVQSYFAYSNTSSITFYPDPNHEWGGYKPDSQ
jgi:hypothetical protein